MSELPNNAITARSALAHVEADSLSVDSRSLTLTLMPVCGFLMLRAVNDGNDLRTALQKHYDLSLPERLQSQSQDDRCIRWMSPDAWLLSCPENTVENLEQHLRESVSGHVAIVNVSGGYAGFELHGSNARRVLMKSTGYDVHPDNFQAGKVVNTVFAKAQVTLRCVQDNHYEILVRRSFADYLWLWLQRAGKEYAMVTRATTA